MKISLLSQREPFDDILEQTLTNFFYSYFGYHYKIEWKDGEKTKKTNNESQIWLCNPYINGIFVPDVCKEVLSPLLNEFSRSIIPWQTPLQSLYVRLATRKNTARWLASKILLISPPIKDANKLLIIGGSNHIRILDYKERCCFVITKSGFDKSFLTNEIDIRLENSYLPTPKIFKISDDKSWYCEELIFGTPINRLKNASIGEDILKEIVKSLFALYKKTAEEVMVKDYTENVLVNIVRLTENNNLIDLNKKKAIKKIAEGLNKYISRKINKGPKNIMVCQTHGDLQPANILFDGEKSWLIDWEYTSRRQIFYDGLVYMFASRFPQDISRRFKQAIDNDFDNFSFMIESWPYLEWDNKAQKQLALMLFLLEELELKLIENSNSLFNTIDQGFESFWEEVKFSTEVLKN